MKNSFKTEDLGKYVILNLNQTPAKKIEGLLVGLTESGLSLRVGLGWSRGRSTQQEIPYDCIQNCYFTRFKVDI